MIDRYDFMASYRGEMAAGPFFVLLFVVLVCVYVAYLVMSESLSLVRLPDILNKPPSRQENLDASIRSAKFMTLFSMVYDAEFINRKRFEGMLADLSSVLDDLILDAWTVRANRKAAINGTGFVRMTDGIIAQLDEYRSKKNTIFTEILDKLNSVVGSRVIVYDTKSIKEDLREWIMILTAVENSA
jgi:hypothetical protein